MSALKTWILFFCAAFLFAACSDDGSPSKVSVDELGDVDSSSSDDDGSKPEGSNPTAKSGSSSKPGDKIVINGGKDTIYVADAEGSLYYSSGVFCWTEGCEKNFAPSSSAATKPASSETNVSGGSSSSKGNSSSSVKQSSSSQAPAVSVDSRAPTVDMTAMKLTDVRNNQTYSLLKIGSVYWMESNLTYKPNTGYQCDATVEIETEPGPEATKETVNVCDHYGIYYTYSARDVVCPSGWRLPTKDEVDAALASMEEKTRKELDEWWVLGGRFKQEGSKWLFGNNNGQGHLWIQKSSANEVAIRFQDYGSWETPKYVTADDQTEKRAYNVRCVMSE